MPVVTLLPSARQFTIDGKETLLEGALRAGLALNYGCSNGNCGLCKAKLLAGEIEKVRYHDYILSARAKQANEILLCAYAACSDVCLETQQAARAADIPRQTIVTQVKKIEYPADAIALLNLQTPRTQRLRFLAGQNASLSFNGSAMCTLPIASCPCDDRNLQFHLHRQTDHVFVQQIFDGLERNAPVTVVAPQGSFVLEESPNAEGLLFFACDTGFAPLRSLIEHALASGWEKPIALYWFAGGGGGHYMHTLMHAWRDAFDNFDYYPLSYAGDADADQLGPMLTDKLPAFCADQVVYMAGQLPFVQALNGLFNALGVPTAQRHHQVLKHGLCLP